MSKIIDYNRSVNKDEGTEQGSGAWAFGAVNFDTYSMIMNYINSTNNFDWKTLSSDPKTDLQVVVNNPNKYWDWGWQLLAHFIMFYFFLFGLKR